MNDSTAIGHLTIGCAALVSIPLLGGWGLIVCVVILAAWIKYGS